MSGMSKRKHFELLVFLNDTTLLFRYLANSKYSWQMSSNVQWEKIPFNHLLKVHLERSFSTFQIFVMSSFVLKMAPNIIMGLKLMIYVRSNGELWRLTVLILDTGTKIASVLYQDFKSLVSHPKCDLDSLLWPPPSSVANFRYMWWQNKRLL